MNYLKQLLFYFILIEVGLFTFSCKNKNIDKAEEIVREWIGKFIVFPTSSMCVSLNKRIDCILPESTPYKILIYMDSTGCTDCKLQLHKWSILINESKKEMLGLVNFQFYIHPKNEKELLMILQRYNFEYPIHIDKENELNELNKFYPDNKYHTFLLNKENRVVLIGNPINTTQIWSLYKQVINGGKLKDIDSGTIEEITTIEVKETTRLVNNMKVGKISTVMFKIKNTGDKFLFIKDINVSCGCVVPKWEKKLIRPGETTKIGIQIIPKSRGYFQKKIVVISNIEESEIIFIVKGMVKM